MDTQNQTNHPHFAKPELEDKSIRSSPAEIPNNELADKPKTFRNILFVLFITALFILVFFMATNLRSYLGT